VMDLIPASERVRWNALESFNQAGWAGSAVLGGFLMDAYGVELNFSVTIVMQTLSLLPVVGIAHLVPNETGATNIIEICRNWLQK
jgi:predicted MFS family arabinose efflux permease